MRIGKVRVLAAILLASASGGMAMAGTMTAAAVERSAGQGDVDMRGAWVERSQIFYRPEDRSVFRATVRVFDPTPERNLDFTWEPAEGQGIAAGPQGGLSGKGKLVWRVRGSADYDKRSIFSVYDGELVDGRPEGTGRLEVRTGEVWQGSWRQGRFEGTGFRLDADGNRREGSFVDGLLDGQGIERLATGEIHTGGFRKGLRHGTGTTRLPGGTAYTSAWSMGLEIGGNRPDVLADANVGGLLRAQAGGGDAGKTEIAVALDQRMTQQADMRYVQLVRDDDIAIYPEDEEMNAAWNGTAGVSMSGYLYTGIDWENVPAFMEVRVATTDGSRVRLESLALDVKQSDAYRKPMLVSESHFGCVGFRPDFSILNNGWGAVKDAKLSVQFVSDDNPDQASRAFETDVGNFDDGIDVSVLGMLEEAGVDVAALQAGRFSCPSMEQMPVCKNQVMNKLKLGDLKDFVWGEQRLSTTARGKLSYSWSDDYGNNYPVSEDIGFDIALAFIETTGEAPECGDGFGGAPEALRYQDVKFRLGEQNYRVPIEVRGNKTIKDTVARLKLRADMSSFHAFSAVAAFGDGSERRSKPVSLFYFRPRPSGFQSQARPPVCTLPATIEGC